MKVLVLCALLVGACVALHERFDGHKLYKFTPTHRRHVEAFSALQADGELIDFWRFPNSVGKPIEFVLSPENEASVLTALRNYDVTPEVIDENIQTAIDEQLNGMRFRTPYVKGDVRSLTVDDYHTLDEYEQFFQDLASANDFVDAINIGQSHENRDMTLVKIGKASSDGSDKPGFWIDCGIHAREWLSPTFCVWAINEIISQYNQGTQEYVDLVNGIDFYILPNLNPDGYAYTQSSNRLWRKTRSGPYGSCYGVDPNRNWDYKWGTVGASGSGCSDTYYGPSVFSEVENQHARDFILAHGNIQAYFTIHTYSQLWLLPYSDAPGHYPDDNADLTSASNDAVAAIKAVHGKTYEAGTAADILYSVSGGSHDWAKDQGIKWSFAMELRPSGGFNGFVQPASEIVPTSEETPAGVKVIMNKVLAGK